jgi:hypothetical protein
MDRSIIILQLVAMMSDANRKTEYRRPELKVYGEMKVVTQSNATDNKNDKGNGSFSMT